MCPIQMDGWVIVGDLSWGAGGGKSGFKNVIVSNQL